jgi:hypothetical protein
VTGETDSCDIADGRRSLAVAPGGP